MDFQLVYSAPALADLEAIAGWSWGEHPHSTDRFTSSLLDHVELLKSFPYLGSRVRSRPGVRRLTHSPFHVYYHVDPEQRRVEIVRFRHASRRSPQL